jgi:hypothetical protein
MASRQRLTRSRSMLVLPSPLLTLAMMNLTGSMPAISCALLFTVRMD